MDDQFMDKINKYLQVVGLRYEKRLFVVQILSILIGYIGITLWLNRIRATAPLWFVWTLVILQIVLYCLIFSTCYLRAEACGLKRFGFVIFATLFVLGRVNDWELFIIPFTMITMLIVSAKAKKTLRVWSVSDFFKTTKK